VSSGHPAADLLSIDVVIPAFTTKRWQLIERAVESASEQTIRPQRVILSVDNNEELLQRAQVRWSDTDGRVLVVANESTDHLEGRAVHERAHGTSRRFGGGTARNAGARRADADVIAFIDDDAWAESDWTERLLQIYGNPRVVAVGGASLPYYETHRPAWFPDNFDWVFGCSYEGLPRTPSPLRHLIGSNMSVRRTAFEAVGGFVGSDFDDLNLCMRLVEAYGPEAVCYTPNAVVHHYVTRERVSWNYFYRRCYFVNREKVRVHQLIGSAANLKAEVTSFAELSFTRAVS
jgi:GT2 family glycosyltransferase